MVFRVIKDTETSWNTYSSPLNPCTFEVLEPRILLSADGLNNLAPDPLDSLNDAAPKVVIEVELQHTSEQVEEEINQEPDASETINIDIYQKIFTLYVDNNGTDNEIALANAENDIADSSDELDGSVGSDITLAVIVDEPVSDNYTTNNDDGSMPTHINDTDPSAEYANSIEIRGPPTGDTTVDTLAIAALENVALTTENAIQDEYTGDRQTQGLNLPGMHLVDSDANYFDGQIIYLDFDGAEGVTYNGPIVVEGIDIPEFSAEAAGLAGQESEIISQILSTLQYQFEGTGVLFATTKPELGVSYSTIFVGGDDSGLPHFFSPVVMRGFPSYRLHI